ncbi:LysE family translocator [Pseudonocardia acaciae]|uniref:LysE family translocator n=1 Tax=Pseudonocardia acaciae TaxID=551276 RepID=UPI000B19C652|nr:LysE family translocator [Pseudonocardia acaciae]
MLTSALIGFAALCLLLSMAPGPDTFLVLRSTARGGPRAGAFTAAGSAIGSLVWAGAVAVGLAAVLERWGTAYTVVRLLGAAYLIYLGVRALWDSRTAVAPATVVAEGPGLTGWAACRAGLFSALSNPKLGLFFLAVVPQFLPAAQPVLGPVLLLGAIDAAVAMVWLSAVAIGAAALMRWLSRPRVNRAVERVTGLTLIGVGAATALADNR